MATKERWSFPDLQRQLNGALFERTVLAPPKLSSSLTELHPDAASIFKDSYLVEFLNLSRDHSEADLHAGLVESAADIATHAVEIPKLLAFSRLGVQMVA